MGSRSRWVVMLTLILSASAYGGYLDLTTDDSKGTIGGAYFEQISPQSTGTGYIDPFLRIQKGTTEKGYNTDAKKPPFDALAGTWTHSITLAEFLPVTYENVSCIKFMLDVNENSGQNNELISLDQIKIYVNSTSGALDTTNLSDLGTLVYDLDAQTDNWVGMTYGLNSGSGSGDYYMYIPVSVFGPQGLDGRYLYLFTSFGGQGGGWDSSDGFEEWAAIRGDLPTPPVPEPTFYGLLSAGLTGLLLISRRRRQSVQ